MIRAHFTLPCMYLAQEKIVDRLNIPSLSIYHLYSIFPEEKQEFFLLKHWNWYRKANFCVPYIKLLILINWKSSNTVAFTKYKHAQSMIYCKTFRQQKKWQRQSQSSRKKPMNQWTGGGSLSCHPFPFFAPPFSPHYEQLVWARGRAVKFSLRVYSVHGVVFAIVVHHTFVCETHIHTLTQLHSTAVMSPLHQQLK